MQNIQFINAGAGSGKTYELTGILTENIKNGKCNADQVILTTFTEKAAAEFKTKAREKLLEAGMPDQANLLASAAIGTVHSVALQLIKKYWYLPGVSPELVVMPNEDTDFFINQALANIPDPKELSGLRNIAEQFGFSRAMRSGTDYDYWKEHVKEILNLSISNRIQELDESKRLSLEDIKQVFPPGDFNVTEEESRKLLEKFLNIVENDKESKEKTKRVNKITGILQKTNWTIPDFIAASRALDNHTKAHEKSLPELPVVAHRIKQIYRSPAFLKHMQSYVEIVFSIARRSLEAYREYKLKNRIIDYADMEDMFLDLLENKNVKEEISSRFRQVYVDEFQDSSPVQFAIFNKLSGLMAQSYWVGDPKQAIYGFRGTDPALIKTIVDEFTTKAGDRGLTTKNLNYSWRSRPEIVHLCNAVFRKALKNQVDPSLISLDPVRSDNELPPTEHCFPVQHWHHTYEQSKSANISLKWQHLAEHIHSLLNSEMEVTVKEKCKYSVEKKKPDTVVKSPMKPSDIAILCRKNESVSQLSSALKKAGLKVSSKQHGLIETTETQLLIAAINYLLNPSDQLAKAVMILLSGEKTSASELIDDRLEHLYHSNAPARPFFVEGEPDEDEEDGFQAWYEYLNQWHGENQLLKNIEALQPDIAWLSVPLIIEKLIINCGLDELTSKWDNAAQRQANLQTLASFAQKYDQRCLALKMAPSLRGYIQYIQHLPASTLMESAAAGDDAVNVLTWHGSKGLEWPVVILSELEHDALDEADLIRKEFFGASLVNPGETNLDAPFSGKYITLIPWPFGAAIKVPDETIANNIRQHTRFSWIRDKAKNELARLLYVGFTRARDVLVTTSYSKNKLTWLTNALDNVPLGEELKKLTEGQTQSDIFGCNIPVLVHVKYFEPELRDKDDAIEVPVKVFKTKRMDAHYEEKYVSPSTVDPKISGNVTLLKNFNHRIGIKGTANLDDAAIGDCLHDVFGAYATDIKSDTYITLVANTIGRHQLEGVIPQPEQVYVAIQHLYSFMNETYGTPLKIYRELPLQMYKNGQVYRGEADLLWETGTKLILVDYKSYPGKTDHVTDPRNTHYAGSFSGQLSTYKEMIDASHPAGKKVSETLIYYPVLGCVVKVNAS